MYIKNKNNKINYLNNFQYFICKNKSFFFTNHDNFLKTLNKILFL